MVVFLAEALYDRLLDYEENVRMGAGTVLRCVEGYNLGLVGSPRLLWSCGGTMVPLFPCDSLTVLLVKLFCGCCCRLQAGGVASKRKKVATSGKPKRPPSAFFVFM
jgi:hypothetical protein